MPKIMQMYADLLKFAQNTAVLSFWNTTCLLFIVGVLNELLIFLAQTVVCFCH